MPTYDYRCPNGHDFERFYRRFSEAAAELECPVCGAVAARRVSGGAGLVFKGSGFYLTDYGKNAHRKGAADTSGPTSGGESSGGGGDSAKSDANSATAAKSDGAASPSKSDTAKTTDSKLSGKTKGSDSK
jgi:putative FmdB family regulatory protein